MNYIVLDLEWNQADDEKTKLESGLMFEIIEIGAVKLNENKQQQSSFHELIKPQVFNRMNQITGELIHISMNELENCRCFQEVLKDFIKWCGEDYIFCTWGNIDLLELQRNMDFYHLPPLSGNSIKYYDVQKLFSIDFEDGKKRCTLQHAVEFLKIKEEASFHRADADAFYTAEVLKHIKDETLKNYSFDTYRLPQNKTQEIYVRFDDYAKYISREFSSKPSAMGDRDVVSTKCFLCGSKTRKRVPWFSGNGKNYYAIMICPKHGYIKGKIRMKKSIHDKIYVIKTMKKVGLDTVDDIIKKREQIREIRREKRHRTS